MNSNVDVFPWWPSDEERAAIRASFVRFIPRSADAVGRFYATLFQQVPAARALFPTEMEEMEEKMVSMLAFLVDRLDDRERFARECKALGARHVRYGARPEHYPVVGTTLIGALDTESGLILTPGEVELWTRLYNLISAFMLLGASECDGTLPPE